MAARVLIAGLPGTGKGIVAAILACSPDLDVNFASWPNKGDHQRGDYDLVIVTTRKRDHQLTSTRRKFAMRITKKQAVEIRQRGIVQLGDDIPNPDLVWPYEHTVLYGPDETIRQLAPALGVDPWPYTGPEIYDGNAPPAPGLPPRVAPIAWGDDG